MDGLVGGEIKKGRGGEGEESVGSFEEASWLMEVAALSIIHFLLLIISLYNYLNYFITHHQPYNFIKYKH